MNAPVSNTAIPAKAPNPLGAVAQQAATPAQSPKPAAPVASATPAKAPAAPVVQASARPVAAVAPAQSPMPSTPSTPPRAAGTNSLTLEQFEKEVTALGAAFGQGQNSRPSMAVRAVEASAKVTAIGPDLAEILWTKFQTAAAKKKGLEYKQEGSFKQQVSKFRQFLAMGSLPSIDSIDVMDRTVDMIRSLSSQADSPLKGSAYDQMVNVARAQLSSPEKALTDNQIKEVLIPEDPETKSDIEKLVDTYKKVCKSHDLNLPSEAKVAIEDAIENFQTAIHKAGGKVPVTTQAGPVEEADIKAAADKAKADAAAKSAKV